MEEKASCDELFDDCLLLPGMLQWCLCRGVNADVTQTVGQRGSDLGCEDFERLLLDAGARSQNASKPWVENHLQWICWKLAAKEAQHTKLKGKLLDADVVLDELKMRYGQKPLHQASAGPCNIM